MVTGVLVEEDEYSSPLLGDSGKSSDSSSRIGPRLRVAAPRPASTLVPCNCVTSSSHLTLKEDEGRSAGSARFRQSLVRSFNDTHMLWKRKRSPSPAWMSDAIFAVLSSQRLTNIAKLREWSMRYGSDGKPSLKVGGSRWRIAIGVLYEGGIGGAGVVVVDMEQISSKYFLNSTRCVLRNAFIGSIQASLVPNEDMLANPCSDLAMRVNVLRAFVLG